MVAEFVVSRFWAGTNSSPKYLLAIGREVVDKLFRDFETAQAEAEGEAAQAEGKKDSDPDPKAAPTRVGEIDSPEAQSWPSEETSTKEVEGEAAPEAAATQQRSVQDPCAQEPQASPEEAGVAAQDVGKDNAGAVPQTQLLVEGRPLDDQNLYKKVGTEYYLRSKSRWIPSLNGEHWQALIALYILLHEHHDFFLASQNPSGSPELQRLAKKYAMDTSMFKGIDAFLEVLHYRLPESLEFMGTFIPLAYSMLAILNETIPQFHLTGVEYKGNVALSK